MTQTHHLSAASPDLHAQSLKRRRFQQRQRVSYLMMTLAMMSLAFGLFWLCWILFEVLRQGLAGLTLGLFLEMTPGAGEETGGLLNAMYGSLLMVSLASLLGTPIGILSGIYLAEFEPNGRIAGLIRFVNDILLSAPSIVIGLFVYSIVVAPMKSYSAYAGIVALALIVIPVVIRTTENMLLLVPQGLRESAYALGTPKWRVVLSITLKAARAGIVTGALLAVARIAGETAPLLYTALNNQFWSSDLSQPMASLPTVIFQFAMAPDENWNRLAWAGVFLITMAVLGLNILARWLSKQKH